MSYTGSMQSTNTTYILSDVRTFRNTPCQVNQNETDSVVYIPIKSYTPVIPLDKTRHTTGCLIYSIVFLAIFAFLRIRGKGLLPVLFQIVVKKKKFEIILNDGITPNLIYYFLGLLLSFSALAIGIEYLIHLQLDLKHIFYLFIALLFYHLILLSLTLFLSWTFNARYTGEEIIINLWVFNILCGLLISPFIMALFFVKIFAIPVLLKFITICLALFYLVKFIRWVEILFAHRVSIFYMILYLCALEVIPLLVLYKLLVY